MPKEEDEIAEKEKEETRGIDVQFPYHDPIGRFYSKDDLILLLESELSFWRNIQKLYQNGKEFEYQMRPINSLLAWVKNYKGNFSQEQFGDNFQNMINKNYIEPVEFGYFLSFSPIGRIIQRLSEMSGEQAHGALVFFRRRENENKNLSKLERDGYNLAKDIWTIPRDPADVLIKNFRIFQSTLSEDFSKFRSEKDSEFSSFIIEKSGEIEPIKKVMLAEITSSRPVEFWRGKHERHAKRSKLLHVIFSVGVGVLVFIFVLKILGYIDFGQLDIQSYQSIGSTVALASVVGLWIWALRIVLRLAITHTHLAEDAQERITMIESYLALLKFQSENTKPIDIDLSHIIQALFRPASTGLIKDEISSPQLIDTIMSMVSAVRRP